MNKTALQMLLLGLSTVCSLALTGTVIAREFGGGTHRAAETATVKTWRNVAAVGHAVGGANAPVTLTVFSDYQCPYCRGFKAQVDSLRREFGPRLRVVYRHFPLETIHPYARGAAIAAECAAEQGRFETYDSLLFAVQDSLGALGWDRLAIRAGVPDSAQFRTCLAEPAAATRVARDLTAGADLGLNSTPSILLNETRFIRAPDFAELEKRVARATR